MKRFVAVCAFSAWSAGILPAAAGDLALIPMPREMTATAGECRVKEATVKLLDRSTEAGETPALPAEGYELSVTPEGATITAGGEAGVFYARQTLRQLERRDAKGRFTSYPCVEIRDWPAFRWRGVHFDDVRHFFGKETVKRILDEMSRYKFNVFHWHLTDNQGWVLDIPDFPELVKQGRGKEFGAAVGPFHYTADDVREVLAYAAARHITVVPEVEFPGHFGAARRAYPDLACPGGGKVMCIGNPDAVRFAEKVLDYVCELFPSEVVHIGGDECTRKFWESCPRCQAFMREQGFANAGQLQGWLSRHLADYLAAKGRRAIGWDEIFDGGLDLPPGAMGMCWRPADGTFHEGNGAGAQAAKAGHEIVMCPHSHCYFDYSQGLDEDPFPYFLKGKRGSTLENVYVFDPLAGVADEARRFVAGGQCCNWAERTFALADREWKLWPRALALAEVLWTHPAPSARDYAAFARRAAVHRRRLIAEGVNCAPVPPPANGAAAFDAQMAVQGDGGDESGLKWIDGRDLPLEGRAFTDTELYYDRLPSNVTTAVNKGVRNLLRNTAGMQFRFTTDSKRLVFKWVPTSPSLAMDHMPSTGASGLDVYRLDAASGKWRYVKTGRIRDASGGRLALDWQPGTPCLVNLPLYNGVKSFALGVEPGAKVAAAPPRKSGVEKPVVFYGTSITQGGCASRPGMAFVNIVGRELDVPVVNLGFSGSGLMEREMAEHLAAIDASCYILDCVTNMRRMKARDFTARYEDFIRLLRERRPDVPIVMAGMCDVYGGEPNDKDECVKALHDKLVAEGWRNLVHLPKDGMYAGDGEGTVDGVHANDYGMMALAGAYGAAVREALGLGESGPAKRTAKAAGAQWVEESADASGATGDWSRPVAYDGATGRAEISGGDIAFTPFGPSAGSFVTLKVATTLERPGVEADRAPGADAQAAVRLDPTDRFQIWTKAERADAPSAGAGWLDVSAEGVEPVAGAEYALTFTLDYAAGRYAVAVADAEGAWRAMRSAAGAQTFAIARADAYAVTAVAFCGETTFRSLAGSYVTRRQP